MGRYGSEFICSLKFPCPREIPLFCVHNTQITPSVYNVVGWIRTVRVHARSLDTMIIRPRVLLVVRMPEAEWGVAPVDSSSSTATGTLDAVQLTISRC